MSWWWCMLILTYIGIIQSAEYVPKNLYVQLVGISNFVVPHCVLPLVMIALLKTNWAWDNSYLIIPTLLWTSMTFGLRTNTRGRASLNSHSQISCPRHDIGTTITILLSLISVLIYSTSHPWCRTTVQTRWVPMWFILRDVTDPVQWFTWSVDMGKGLWSLGKTRSQWRRGPERSGGVTYVGTAVPSN